MGSTKRNQKCPNADQLPPFLEACHDGVTGYQYPTSNTSKLSLSCFQYGGGENIRQNIFLKIHQGIEPYAFGESVSGTPSD